jgi:hypothetical protein
VADLVHRHVQAGVEHPRHVDWPALHVVVSCEGVEVAHDEPDPLGTLAGILEQVEQLRHLIERDARPRISDVSAGAAEPPDRRV